MQNMKNKKSAGPDKINIEMIKDSIHVFSKVICHLSNLSWKQGVFPVLLKQALIIRVLQSGDRLDLSNYRPIS